MGGEQSHPPPPTGIQIWHKYGQHDIERYSFGDLIEFKRSGYSHWAMYYKNGNIVHLNPSNCGEKVGPLNAGKWYDGAVTIESLASIAGTDMIQAHSSSSGSRPNEDIEILIEILSGSNLLPYCLLQFNCEHFVNFLKFARPISMQVMLLDPLQSVKPTIFGPRFDMVDAMAKILITPKLKTRPEATGYEEKKRELREICATVGKEVKRKQRTEIEKMFC